MRYLQTLNNIAAENNSTVVFPVPMDLFSKLAGGMTSISGKNSVGGKLQFVTKMFLDEIPDSLVSNKPTSVSIG